MTMNQRGHSIGALAALSGLTTPTVRYYEEIGLIRPAERQASGHRRYGAEDVSRLTFIRRCRDFGFPLDDVRKLAALIEDGERSCSEVRDIGLRHLEIVRGKLVELQELEKSLTAFVKDCYDSCSGGPTRDCIHSKTGR